MGCKQQAPTALDCCIRQLPAGCDRKITGLQLYLSTTQSKPCKIHLKDSALNPPELPITADAGSTETGTLIFKDTKVQLIISLPTVILSVGTDL